MRKVSVYIAHGSYAASCCIDSSMPSILQQKQRFSEIFLTTSSNTLQKVHIYIQNVLLLHMLGLHVILNPIQITLLALESAWARRKLSYAKSGMKCLAGMTLPC